VITIVDYGMGNIQAFTNVFRRNHIPVNVADSPRDLETASKLIIPGVGSFDHAMKKLNNSGMRPSLEHLVLEKKTPTLGVCVGMQMLANTSEEGLLKGLGWVPGSVKLFDESLRLPHMGWNNVDPLIDSPLFRDLESEASFYFLHSYYFECERQGDAIATTSYGQAFTSAVSSGNVYGVQFHPEKSHHFGNTLLKNFAEL
jgi:imidazole glycerol-phosphate synthase subunit HisH